ncbi:hypothetical protein [Streptomyces sp. NRRL S-378]|uniref:hypothetical protein n=1 Tax=Streptomyces sp. NRRL S-378 TaxID=1463904 RepID=UPI0004C6A6BB|nr:hypothetical protein [Streptomyces sp. NRRL S-378]
MPQRGETHPTRAVLRRPRPRSGRKPGQGPVRPGAVLALALAAALGAAVAGAVLPHGLLLAAGLIAAAVAVIRSGTAGRDRGRRP